jgi:hypothetical protein
MARRGGSLWLFLAGVEACRLVDPTDSCDLSVQSPQGTPLRELTFDPLGTRKELPLFPGHWSASVVGDTLVHRVARSSLP